MTHSLLSLLWDFFANLIFPDNILALQHTKCRLVAVTQLHKAALLFFSPGALLVQKQTHFTSPQLPLANSPAVQKNQAGMCHEAKIEAGPAVYCMQKGLLTPLHLDISYIYPSKSKPLSTTLMWAIHLSCISQGKFISEKCRQ